MATMGVKGLTCCYSTLCCC